MIKINVKSKFISVFNLMTKIVEFFEMRNNNGYSPVIQ